MLRLSLVTVVWGLLPAAKSLAEASVWKGFASRAGDFGAFFVRSAPKFGVHLLATNNLPLILTNWRYKEGANQFQVVIEGNYFPQLHTFLTKAVGSSRGSLTTNTPGTSTRRVQGYYGTNAMANVTCFWVIDEGKEYTSVGIVSWRTSASDQERFATMLSNAAQNLYSPDKSLDAVRLSAPYVSDFVRLFPGTELRHRDGGFDLTVDLYQRYQFGMKLPVRFDSSQQNVVGYGAPEFYLWEVSSVKRNKSGIAEISFAPAGGRQFGAAEWQKIVDAEGDFSSIGYIMITNQAVPGFADRLVPK